MYRFREFIVDPRSRTLRTDEGIVQLTRRSFDLLLYLVQHPGQVLGKDELIKNIWADTFVDENSLAQSISVLRKALNQRQGENVYILTLPGRGYQFVCPVQVIANNTGTELPIVEPVHTLSSTNSPRRSTLLSPRFYLALVALAAVGAGGYFIWQQVHPAPQIIQAVLSDFENSAKDPDFDSTLNRAIQIDLEQSPFISLLPSSSVRETLQQMQKPKDSPLTPDLAREICQRNNYQVVLHGSIARFGNKYALILEANSCVTGKAVAGYKAEVANKDEVLSALDAATNQVRKQLGESTTSLERFQTPIRQATTPSLEALVAYSEGLSAAESGKLKSAQSLYQQAIKLDPDFASAYRAQAITYYNLSDYDQASSTIQKAYDLRNKTTEHERIDIEVAYYYFGNFDFESAINALKLQAQSYPNNIKPLSRLCNLYTQLGDYKQAISAGEEAFRQDNKNAYAAEVLARAYKRANRYADAKRIAKIATDNGVDFWGIHSILFQIAFAEKNMTALDAESEWGLTHEQSNMSLYNLGYASASEGKVKDAVNFFSRAYSESLRNGDTDFANSNLMSIADVLTNLDDLTAAREQLKKVKVGKYPQTDLILLKTKLGDNQDAERFVASTNISTEKNTLLLYSDYPLIRAQLALNAHKPTDAVEALESARVYQLRDFSVPYMRADAEAQAGMLDAAVSDYRLILANQGVDPIAPVYYISHLRLARVLAKQHKIVESVSEYKAFLNAWKDADPDQPLLIQAKDELQKLH